jgi:hypothetical protein
MAIYGQNAILNGYIPTISINDVVEGQILAYNGEAHAFINADRCGNIFVEGIKDIVPPGKCLTIEERHQYIVTGRMSNFGHIRNFGRLAIL